MTGRPQTWTAHRLELVGENASPSPEESYSGDVHSFSGGAQGDSGGRKKRETRAAAGRQNEVGRRL